MGRRKKHEEHVNHERWLVSYADFITLLFAFFVIMYATSTVDAEKLQQVVASIRGAMNLDTTGVDAPPVFDHPFMHDSPVRRDRGSITKGIETTAPLELVRVKEKVEERLKTLEGQRPPEGVITLEIVERGIRIRLLSAYFFDSGSSVLRPTAIPVVDAIGDVLTNISNKLRVEGHSDSAAGVDPFLNWQLSSDRALEIIRYFTEAHDIDPARQALAAYAHYRPITGNDSVEGRALNRRIEIFVLTQSSGVHMGEPDTSDAKGWE